MRAADIAAAGWHRLGDIVSALPPGSAASIDGFNYQLTARQVPFAGAPRTTVVSWSVRLDGQRIPVVIDGMWILDALPIAMTQIDSVVIATGPRIVDGHATFLGTIDLYARRPMKGLSVIGDYQHGNESGDPGPYRYTSRANGNVERLGPFGGGAVAFGRTRWSVDGAARYSSLNITDENILNRFPTTFGQLQSDVNASGGSGVLRTSFAGATQSTIGGRGRFTGLFLDPSTGREESVRVITSHAGSSGNAVLGDVGFRYGVTGTSLDVRERRSPLAFTLGHTRTMGETFVEASSARLPLALGAGVTSWRNERADSSQTRVTERVWLAYNGRGATASLVAEHGSSGTTVSGMATYERWLPDSQVVSFAATYLRAMSDGDDVWVDRSRSLFPPPNGVAMVELRGEVTAADNRNIVPTLYVRGSMLSGLRANMTSFPDSPDLVYAGGLILETPQAKRVSLLVRGEATSQSGRVDPGQENTAASFVEASVSTVAATNFRLAASARYTASTSWVGQGATRNLPGLRRVDFSANKPFWRERIRMQLIIRNLFDTAEIYHPLGAQWNLRTHLAITVALPPYVSRSGGA